MKIRLRPDGPGMREPSESEMNDWLANLREDDEAEPADTPNAAEAELDGIPEAAAMAPETDGAIEASGPAEPYEATETSGVNWGPVGDTGNGDAHLLLGAPVSAVADTTDFVDADETAEPYGVVPRVTTEPAEPMPTGVTGEAHDTGQRDVAAEPAGVTAGVNGHDQISGPAEVGTGPSLARETWAPAANTAPAGAADWARTSGTGVPGTAARGPEPEAGGGPQVAPAGRRLAPGGRRPQAPIETPVRALIGEEMRTPTVWCELEPRTCISWYADREALGVADVRERAITVGWRIDALGRLTCPQCQQRSASFRTTQPVVLWSRAYALTMAAREAARQGGYRYPQPAFYPR